MHSMTASILALAVAFAFAGSAAQAEELGKSGKPLTAQQLRMKNCNAEARTQELKGDQRKTFMSSCLRGESAKADDQAAPAVARTPTPRQLQRQACGAEAKAQGYKGDERKDFVKECMKGSKAIADARS